MTLPRKVIVLGILVFACDAPDEVPPDDETPAQLEDRFDLGTGLDVETETPPAAPAGSTFTVGAGTPTPTVSVEDAHALGDGDRLDEVEVRQGGPEGAPKIPRAGEVCTASSECEAGTQCVSDAIGSDGELRCLTVCVDPTADNAGSIECVDDEGCCDDAAVCNEQGDCVLPGGGGGGGSDPAADGKGCNQGCDYDRDDDGVVNSFDANPDQSCSADGDGDGVRDSCDANDMESDDGCFFCGVPRLRTNGLFWAYAVIFLVLRQRRRPRR